MKLFSEFNLSPALMSAITDLKFEKPSPIQAQTLPILLDKPTDFVGLAATGTGKTAAFSIPLIEKIDSSKRAVQVLVLCPTRELAVQVAGQIELLGKHKGIKAVCVYGGSGYSDQIYGFKKGLPVVVGTPGRIIDHLEKGTLKLDAVHTVILDEADEMISMGFREAIESILSNVPSENRKTWLFSATMGPEVRRVAEKFLNNPQRVQVNKDEMLSSTVEQLFYATREANKPDIVCKLIDAAEDFYGLIFCQTKALVVDLTRYLTERGYKVDCLHGDRSQAERERSIKSFRDRKVNILVGTDVAARGLDVKDVSHVINYSIPFELDLYVHRIGRTARSGKKGLALSLVTPAHRNLISRIERMTKSKIREDVLPSRKDIGIKKTNKILENFMSVENHQRAQAVLSDQWKEKIAEISKEEIAARFLALTMPDLFNNQEKERVSLGTQREHSSERYAEKPRRDNRSKGNPWQKTSKWKNNKYGSYMPKERR